jgi:hypothetical protein
VLHHAVVVAGHGARADIRARAELRIADIAEVIDLGALADGRGLDLDEIADLRASLPISAPGRSRA